MNRAYKDHTPNQDTFRNEEEILITSIREMVDRWMRSFDEHLNCDATEGDVMEINLRVPNSRKIRTVVSSRLSGGTR